MFLTFIYASGYGEDGSNGRGGLEDGMDGLAKSWPKSTCRKAGDGLRVGRRYVFHGVESRRG